MRTIREVRDTGFTTDRSLPSAIGQGNSAPADLWAHKLPC